MISGCADQIDLPTPSDPLETKTSHCGQPRRSMSPSKPFSDEYILRKSDNEAMNEFAFYQLIYGNSEAGRPKTLFVHLIFMVFSPNTRGDLHSRPKRGQRHRRVAYTYSWLVGCRWLFVFRYTGVRWLVECFEFFLCSVFAII